MDPSALAAPPQGKPPRRLLAPFHGEAVTPPPIWLMRQAGRYLPEYRALRSKVATFLDLCYSPELAVEVTLQPIRRFGLDAAILFSDILVVPDALGQAVRFVEGEGPKLDPVRTAQDLAGLRPQATRAKLARVCEIVARLRRDLPRETALIGFCGAPWTVATYMVGGESSSDQKEARLWAYRDPEGFGALMDILVEVSADYLAAQVEAGADVLQIFDTWAGSLSEAAYEDWVIAPTARIVKSLRSRLLDVPILGFPRGNAALLARYRAGTGVDGVSCDSGVPFATMTELGTAAVVQGNLDPMLLVVGGEALDKGVRALLEAMRGRRYVFNLGHGILPETPPEHVARLVELVRSHAASAPAGQ